MTAQSRQRRFGLRARATAAFGAGAALVSVALALLTFGLVHHYLLAQREVSATTETYSDARVVKRDMVLGGATVEDVLSSLTVPQGTVVFVLQRHQWYSASVAVGGTGAATGVGAGPTGPGGASRPSGLPAALVAMVAGGQPARQRVAFDGKPAIAVGLPLAAAGADYFEVHSLVELRRTLDLLALVLLVCAAATTLGGLFIGRWASGRLVRPLNVAADVAAAIAGGALDKRLPLGDDPDLAVLAVSFNEMVEALAKRVRRDARFASDVSHELRSPLTTVQASVELLARCRADLDAEGRRALDLLTSEVARFSTMVQDLLEISRSDAGAAGLDLEELDLEDLVANTVAAYTAGAVPVAVPPGLEGVWVLADRRRLQRVLVNLLDNAAAHAGGAVAVALRADGRTAEILVDDAGPGVTPDEREAIFERFYRGGASGRRGGTGGSGLGLALVLEHVRAQGGHVKVTDRPGGGARFVVTLPIVPVAPLRPAGPGPAGGTAGSDGGGRRGTAGATGARLGREVRRPAR